MKHGYEHPAKDTGRESTQHISYICKILLKQYSISFTFRIVQNSVSVHLKVRKRTIKVHSEAISAEHVDVSSHLGESGSDTNLALRFDARQAAEDYLC